MGIGLKLKRSQVTWQNEEALKGNLLIQNHLGQQLMRKSINLQMGELYNLYTPDLEAGVYYLSLMSEDYTAVTKMVIKK